MAIYNPLTCYEPKLLVDFDDSETSAMIFMEESGDIDTEPSYLCDAELDDEIIGKALSSPLFIQESPFTHTQVRADPYTNFVRVKKRKSRREMENERIRIFLERQKEHILADFRTEIQKHEFQADSDGRSIPELNGELSSLSEEKLIILLQVMNNSERSTTSSRTTIRTKSGSS